MKSFNFIHKKDLGDSTTIEDISFPSDMTLGEFVEYAKTLNIFNMTYALNGNIISDGFEMHKNKNYVSPDGWGFVKTDLEIDYIKNVLYNQKVKSAYYNGGWGQATFCVHIDFDIDWIRYAYKDNVGTKL